MATVKCVAGTSECACGVEGACDDGLACQAGLCLPATISWDATAIDVAVSDAPLAGDSPQSDDAAQPGCDRAPVPDSCPCAANADCSSGFCLPSRDGGAACAQACTSSCPEGLACSFVSLPGADPTYLCVDPALNLCRPCEDDAACQRDTPAATGARCVEYGASGAFCGLPCATDPDCPEGFACRDARARLTGASVRQCVLADEGASCPCSGRAIEEAASTACEVEGCVGVRVCEADGLTACLGADGAVCQPAATVEVNFDPQGGALEGPARRLVTVGAPYGSLPAASRAGYTADGWWTEPSAEGIRVEADSVVTRADPHTLHAAWSPRRYLVSFDSAGGSACPTREVTFGAAYGASGPLCEPSRPGHVFAGWRLGPDGPVGLVGTTVTAVTIVSTASDHVVTASWEAATSAVTFDSEGGSACPPLLVVLGERYGARAPGGVLCAPARVGMVFGGWFTGDDGTGDPVTAATVVERESDHTLHARWAPRGVTVRFEAAGGVAATPASRVVSFGAPYGALATTSRVGHAFAGWWTTASGAGDEVRPETQVARPDDHALYARWVLDPHPDRVIGLAAGDFHACAVLASGALKCWGSGGSGQLGQGGLGDMKVARTATPVPLEGRVLDVAAGGSHTCALLEGGGVKCWGANDYGQLGYGHRRRLGDDEYLDSYGLVQLGGPAVAIAARENTTCAIVSGGALRCWGRNGEGQLGLGTTVALGDDELPGSAVPVALDVAAVQVSVGAEHVCARLSGGSVRCWGQNWSGQLGLGHTNAIGDNELPATAPVVPLGGAAIHVTAGERHTCALMSGGAVRCWGANGGGQLGLGHTSNLASPQTVPPVALPAPVVALDAGEHKTCAVTEGGALWCFGGESSWTGYSTLSPWYTLGYGGVTVGDDEPPTALGPVPVGAPVVRALSWNARTLAIDASGALRTWGIGTLGFPLVGASAPPCKGYPAACGVLPLYDVPESFLAASKVAIEPESEANNVLSSANTIPTGAAMGGRIGVVGDQDLFRFSLTRTSSVRVTLRALVDAVGRIPGDSCPGDAVVRLLQGDGTLLGLDDDDGLPGGCPAIDPTRDAFAVNLPAGSYAVRVEESGNDAVISRLYRLEVSVLP